MPTYRFSAGDEIRWSNDTWTVVGRVDEPGQTAYRITRDITDTEGVVLRPSRAEIDTNAELLTQANNHG